MMHSRQILLLWITAVVLLLALSLCLPASALSATIYVRTTGNDSNNGSSWDLAKKTVQAGLNASVSGDEVWVAAGTYVQCITLTAGVGLYGGFPANGGDWNARTVGPNVTILDGNKGGSVVTGPSGATSATVIDGFTIRNGSAPAGGGGIYCSSSSPTITNNTITGNSTPNYGAGIYCSSSSPTITDNTIIGNSGGSVGSGGGIYCTYAFPTIADNTITGNSASVGGGICCNYSSPTTTKNTIIANTAYGSGGGVYCYYSAPTITNSLITRNNAADGGGVSCCGSSPTITNNTIAENTAPGGGGMYCFGSSSPRISNNIVAFNSSGVHNESGGTPVLRNNDVYGNAVYDYSGLSAGTGDTCAAPLFASTDYSDLHIQAGSPCANAGWNGAPGLPADDMDGQTRIQGGTVDIGADESDGTTRPVGPPVIVRVSPSGDDANDGSSWGSAKRTVQAAINAAAWGEVWVRSGTYGERITLFSDARIYGGFAGTETARSQRDWPGNATILDGARGGSVVRVSQGCVLGAIDGFTIRNGSNSGMYCSNSSPTITNDTITGNSATNGGGIYCTGSSPMITNTTISGNSASSNGGGIYYTSSSLTITNSTISGNAATFGGGVYCIGPSATITNNTISGNTVSSNGGGIYCSSSSPVIANNAIAANGATYGGGIYCYFSAPTIINNTITRNNAAYSGGVRCYSSSPAVSSNVVAFNSSGIYRSSGTPVLRNNDVYGNTGYNYSGLSAGSGDISADPLFVSSGGGDYHLSPTSACLNKGWNGAAGLPVTDMDGQPRILYGTVDIGADEGCFPLSYSKKSANNSPALAWQATVTAVPSADLFYVEVDDRFCGMLVSKASHGLTPGTRVTVQGTAQTESWGEKYIDAASVTDAGTGTIRPLVLNNRDLGGGDWCYDSSTKTGQKGVKDFTAGDPKRLTYSSGLNNIGMLITTSGKVTYSTTGYFYIDDGYGLADNSGQVGIKVMGSVQPPDPLPPGWTPVGHYVTITGISSCFKAGAPSTDLYRQIWCSQVTLVQ